MLVVTAWRRFNSLRCHPCCVLCLWRAGAGVCVCSMGQALRLPEALCVTETLFVCVGSDSSACCSCSLRQRQWPWLCLFLACFNKKKRVYGRSSVSESRSMSVQVLRESTV